MAPRRIVVVTGSRAEYGLLRWLMHGLDEDARTELFVAVTGMHLSSEFGLTYRAIEEDGFRIDARVDMLLASDEPRAIAKSVGLATIGFADAFERLGPDLVVVLGDRFEILAASQAALLMRIPIAHLHGGELSEGALDDAMRHAITKMSSLHFVAAEAYRRRVIQLGEEPSRVFLAGAPGVDAIERVAPLSRQQLERDLGLPLTSPLFLVTFHPATLSESDALDSVSNLCSALERFPKARVVVTKPNADAAGRSISAAFEHWTSRNSSRVTIHTSLGQHRYLSLLRLADVVIGNSSSGLIEAPAVPVPTVNIGPRQDGRLKAASVLDCGESEAEIVRAITRALSSDHLATTKTMHPPYGGTGASQKIKEVLASFPLEGLSRKRFFDFALGQVPRG